MGLKTFLNINWKWVFNIYSQVSRVISLNFFVKSLNYWIDSIITTLFLLFFLIFFNKYYIAIHLYYYSYPTWQLIPLWLVQRYLEEKSNITTVTYFKQERKLFKVKQAPAVKFSSMRVLRCSFNTWWKSELKDIPHSGYFQNYPLKGSEKDESDKTTQTSTNMEHAGHLRVTWVKCSIQRKRKNKNTPNSYQSPRMCHADTYMKRSTHGKHLFIWCSPMQQVY